MPLAVLTKADRWFSNAVELGEKATFDIFEDLHAVLFRLPDGCGVDRYAECIRIGTGMLDRMKSPSGSMC